MASTWSHGKKASLSPGKVEKYSALEGTHLIQPIAVEYLGPMNIAAYSFFG